jgi:hypothetical protein
LSYGLRGTLSEHLVLKAIRFHDAGFRVFFDVSLFIFLNVIGLLPVFSLRVLTLALNVVLGVIVDTFSEVRYSHFL